MDWIVYWFMLPVCIAIASVAMFSGMSGAAMLIPVFLIGFPLLGVPPLTTVAAIGTSLLLETSGFGTGVYRYLQLRLVDMATAKMLIAVTLPLGAIGALASAQAPEQALRLGYGAAMIGLAFLLAREVHERTPDAVTAAGATDHALVNVTGSDSRIRRGPIPGGPLAAADQPPHRHCPHGTPRSITAASGKSYHFCVHGLRGQRLLSGLGAFVAGLISTGVGEATLPGLIRRSRFPATIAAATSTVVVAGTVVGAALTHMVQLAAADGFTAIPWNLLVWAVPGAILGAVIGTGLQGRISQRVTRWFFAALFLAIGATFLTAFTVFADQFG
ncbi:MAG TPA: sulfite exporter TauE/SafE family protein [Jiangellaceae bacterium]